ncbi:MAG: butyryl-CoA dehydrogenase [Caldilineae bacterium]|nr:MAG: butyryl-CoA dehydrogenase [Caldilineae bacterium]
MDFAYTTEHEMVRDMVRDFAAKEVRPVIADYDREHKFPHFLLERMAELGLLGICIPVRYGGAGMDYISLGIVSEALEWADASVRETIAVHVALNSLAVFQWGTEEQKQRLLKPLATGEKIGCFGLTEPAAGSDVAAMRTTARRDGDDYILNGEKMWITLADVADYMLVFAKTDPEKRHRGITAFMLERGMPGLTTGTIENKMGVWASNTGWIAMNNVRVPKTNRIGQEGEGFKVAMSSLDNARMTVAAGAAGTIRAVMELSLKYAQERVTFGKKIAEHQLVQQMIAKMAMNYDIATLLWQRSAWLKNQGIRNTRETSQAKWFATEAAWEAASDAVQIHGAYGYSGEYEVERYLRNAKGAVIYEGTTQIHQLMQAAYALGWRQDKPLRCELPAYDPDYWQSE